jgi:hypothetical protein
MLNTIKLLPADLRLFDGEGGNAGSATGDTAAASGSTLQTKSGDNILYGKQPDSSDAGSTGVAVTSNTLEDKRKAFKAMVDGEYKDVYTEETQRIINRRFKETQELKKQVDDFQPLKDLLAQRYKVTDGDMSKLLTAIENDNAYWSEAAEEAGMSVEQYKEFQRIQRENEAFRKEAAARDAQQAQRQTLERWFAEGEALKAKYPSFDLNAESENQQFVAMLRSGVPVATAYEVVHMEEIKAGIAQMQARATEEQVVANIKARGSRPSEAGASSQSAFTVKDDVSKFTKKDRADIAQRAARGEKIIL